MTWCPELEKADKVVKYLEPRVLYRNLRNGRFEEVSARPGIAFLLPHEARAAHSAISITMETWMSSSII